MSAGRARGLALALAVALATLAALSLARPTAAQFTGGEPDEAPIVEYIETRPHGDRQFLAVWNHPTPVSTVILLDSDSRIIGMWGPVEAGNELMAQQPGLQGPGELVTILEIWHVDPPPSDQSVATLEGLALGQLLELDGPTLATLVVRYTTLRTGRQLSMPTLEQ